MSPEELQQILSILDEAYKKAGRKIEHAVLVDDIDEEGNIKGEVLIDETEKN